MPKNENTLKRGQACLHCRKRKAVCIFLSIKYLISPSISDVTVVRCLAASIENYLKLYTAKPACISCVKGNHQCVYVDTSALSTSRRRDKISDLEERIRDLENKLATQHLSTSTSFEDTTNAPYFEFSSPEPLLATSNWPYPPIDITLHLIQVFFTCCPVESSHLHKPTLLQTVLLPMTHPEAPHPALMYAIFASASRHSLRTTNSKPRAANGWTERACNSTGNTFLDMSLSTAANYLEVETKSHTSLRDKLKLISAIIILTHLMHRENKWTDLHQFNTLGTRAMVSFKLHLDEKLENPKSRLIASSQSDLEREQRKRCLFLGFLFDTIYASTTSMFPSNLNSRNIYIRLPVSTQMFNQASHDSIIPELEPFTYSSDFLSNHSSDDNFHCLIKAAILLDKVNEFLHGSIGELVESSLSSSNQLPSFNKLDKVISEHKAQLPDYWDRNKNLDILMYFAHMIVHDGTMKLHNGYFREPTSRKRLMGTVRAIISPLYILLNLSFDFTRLPTFVISIYIDAFDILIIAHKNSDESAQAKIVKELGTIMEVIERISEKIPHGVEALKNLNQSLKKNGIPLGTHPEQVDESSLTVFNTIMQQVNNYDVTPQFGEGVLDITATSPLEIPPGMSFPTNDEFKWMNTDDNFNDAFLDTAFIDGNV
ncbi:hypothetical protein E3Q23_03422 [Wallemia mellicola]|uniref:Xylanolytic transcriptional activator regulatory domain-containing protein n=1 Tax=Wallemia mellicola TaxID=1708541 RepID=A0A4T0LR23_9BASI|nr:hypothetical protein E3Q23_03422 [Wallemia mellicola]TIC28001.1 hypothetical protein E3Q10_03454 [Wallemia mellicola]TIC63407.1 hypothetical protein E3Q01_03384 [Wallemia mellicola]